MIWEMVDDMEIHGKIFACYIDNLHMQQIVNICNTMSIYQYHNMLILINCKKL